MYAVSDRRVLHVVRRCPYLRGHAHDEALLLDLIRLDRVVILQDLAGVDELLSRRLPALLCADFLLHCADGLSRLGINRELLLLQVLERELHGGQLFGWLWWVV